MQRFFPELLHRLYILNTPMFFENAWENELSKCLDKETLEKVFISGDDSHDELLAEVEEKDLPEIYGGMCECEATCIYSDIGPWCDYENTINFKDPNAKKKMESGSDEELDMDERNLNSLKFMLGGSKPGQEEFKMEEQDDDNVDLLDEKSKSKDISEFYAQNEQIEDLKNSIMSNMPGMKFGAGAGHQTNNNTEAGDTESSEQQAILIQ